jgi:hypothetical protein
VVAAAQESNTASFSNVFIASLKNPALKEGRKEDRVYRMVARKRCRRKEDRVYRMVARKVSYSSRLQTIPCESKRWWWGKKAARRQDPSL